MLHQDKYLDAADLSRLMLFLWGPALPRDSLELIVDLEGHLKAALEARPVQTLAPRNDALVNEARRGLAALPVADRVRAPQERAFRRRERAAVPRQRSAPGRTRRRFSRARAASR